MADLVRASRTDLKVKPSTGPYPDLITTVNNGIGATTTLEYLPSSSYDNCFDVDGKDTCLPFVTQTLSKTTIDDGNGVLSETDYSYVYGYFDAPDREYRGFGYTRASALYNYNPGNGACIGNADYDCTTTESWFYQDDVFKSFPYKQITSDSNDNVYAWTDNVYDQADPTPYSGVSFPRLIQKDDYGCDGIVTVQQVLDGTASTCKQVRTLFTYDGYGNIQSKQFLGDVSVNDDQRYEYTIYYQDGEVGSYLVSLPKYTCISDVPITNCDENSGLIKAKMSFTYYSNTGNLWTKTAWLNTGPDPVTTYEYDPYYGNTTRITDPKGYSTTITYETTVYTYPWIVTNALSHTAEKTYNYKFGTVLTEKDPNFNTTNYSYDEFGRTIKVTNPNDTGSTYGTISYYYLNLGTVGSQKVVTYATEQSGTANYIWSEAYFDGFGRTYMTRSEGPDSKVIITETAYNDRGLTWGETLPYFEGLETARWRTYQDDPVGRVIRTDNPDGTYATAGYLKGVLTYIDPNGHKKVEEKDIYGRTIKVEEYIGISPSFSLYATTGYEYDVLGNLKKVTDAQNNQTVMNYDTLSRKTSMTDPDMGYWIYQYDSNSNLTYQKDARNQIITFTYDPSNRITLKNYSTGTDVTYTYDQTFSTNSKGRLTTLNDASGTTKFYYDKLGQTTKTINTVDSINYITETSYDALGRTDTLKYPDNAIIKYEYDTGGNLYRVKNNSTGFVYASYTNYNAAGQIGTTDFGNGVNTIYQYLSQNNRLYSITTSKQGTGFMNLSYAYDNAGNITGITDYLDSTRNHTYGYDELNRLTSASSASYGGTLTWQYNTIGNMTYNSRYGNYSYNDPLHRHAVTQAGADTYTYDANGNMTGGAGRTITYDYDNRATSITKAGAATVSVYDAGGQRVKKVIPGATTIYIGKLYECTNGVCTKYIFGGSDRIASIEGANTRYYHTDHLGSSSVITDQNVISVQALYYYPYGEIHTMTGTDVARHKFTGQEYDAETGLYYYGARYYDPKLAKFITADAIVPNFSDPQTLNRFSYCANNPLIYKDPSGHFFIIDDIIVGAVVGAVIGGASAAVQGGNILQGMLVGAVSGAVFAGVSGLASQGIYGLNVPGGVGPVTSGGWLTASQVGGGIAGGAAAGASASAMYGGDVGKGALYGAIGGGAFSAIGAAYGNEWSWDRVAVSGLAGGGVSELAGGKFGDGFMFAAGGAALYWGYQKMVGYEPNRAPGNELKEGTYDSKANGGHPPAGENVCALNKPLSHNFWKDFLTQGGFVSKLINSVPYGCATCALHDRWMNTPAYNLVTSVGSMVPAVAYMSGALLGGPTAPMTIPISTTVRRYADE